MAPGETRAFGEQLGGHRQSRATAIAHIAIFEALNAITPCYRSYAQLTPAAIGAISADAAVAQAAHDTLAALYPSQATAFDAALAEDLAAVRDPNGRDRGIEVGRRAASAILNLRSGDGAEIPEPRLGVDYFPSDDPGQWRQDPISRARLALGAFWNEVLPFVMTSAAQFRAPPPPALTSDKYTSAYKEVKRLGGDGKPTGTPTERTSEQEFIGIFWAYDGMPGVGVTPRLYNQIALTIAKQKRTTGLELARLLALVNVAMADAGIASFDSKYEYAVWRPVAGIRESDPGTGPTGLGDGNPDTIGDPAFTPLGSPATNLAAPGFSPPFPAYPEAHGAFGSAMFEVLRGFYRSDNIAFTFVSDEFNGVNRGSDGVARPLRPRSFSSLSQAEDENGQSRIYLGVHWQFDKTEAIKQGRNVAKHVFANAFRPSGSCPR